MRRRLHNTMSAKARLFWLLLLIGCAILGYCVGSRLMERRSGEILRIEEYTTVITVKITRMESKGIYYIPESSTFDGYNGVEFCLKTKGVRVYNEAGARVSVPSLAAGDRLFLLVNKVGVLSSDPPQLKVYTLMVVKLDS